MDLTIISDRITIFCIVENMYKPFLEPDRMNPASKAFKDITKHKRIIYPLRLRKIFVLKAADHILNIIFNNFRVSFPHSFSL